MTRGQVARAGALTAWLLVAACACTVGAQGSERMAGGAADTVTLTHRVLVGAEMTPVEAKRRAVEGVLAEAVRRLAGVRVQAGQLSIAEDRGGRVTDSFLSAIQLDASGRATDYTVLDERFETTSHPALGPQLYYELRARVTVEHDRGSLDPGFRVTVALNDALFFDNGAGLEGNDELIATVSTTRDGWLTVLAVSDDSVQVLLPNLYMREQRVVAGKAYEFPPPEWRERGLRLRATLPAGRAARREVVVVVATRVPIAFADRAAPRRRAASDMAPVNYPLLALQRWLVSIPLEQRAVAIAAYEVRRR